MTVTKLPVGHYQFVDSENPETIVVPMYVRPNVFKQWIALMLLNIMWVDYPDQL